MATYEKEHDITVPLLTYTDSAEIAKMPYQIGVPLLTVQDFAELGHSPYEITVPLLDISWSHNLHLEEAVNGAYLRDADVGDTDYTDEANDATPNDVPLLPSPVGTDDGFFIGSERQFRWVLVDVGTAGAGTFTIVWQYYNGSTWTAVSILYDSTDWKTTGLGRCHIYIPGDWTKTTIGGQSQYWLFAKYVSGTVTTQPLANQIWCGNFASGKYSGRGYGRGVLMGVLD